MRAHVLQHVPFEGLGSIEAWLLKAGYEITATRFFESIGLPPPGEIDFLIAMGGPMSANDEIEFPWLPAEKTLIREALQAGKPVLGVCLGAQLIAAAMGARVFPNRFREIGWFPVQAVPHTDKAPFPVFRFPAAAEVFHWHGETFDLPAGAIHLAESAGCRHQAFQLGPAAIGLQFHLETTPETLWNLVTHCRAELMPSTYVQPEAVLLSTPAESYRAVNRLMDNVLSFLHV
jgi:GMP synthase-like glutamine amidotransferase